MSLDYSTLLSKRAMDIKPSGIRKFFDMLEDMKDVVALTVGQPDFNTPWHIREAGITSLQKGKTYYTSNAGTMELREELSRYLSRRFSLSYSAKDEIIVTVGGSEAIDLAIRAVVDPDDEVILPVPAFVCYQPIVHLASGKTVEIPLKEENNFRLTADELRAAITDKTKLLILPFPANPTGAIMEKEDMEAIAEVIRGTNILVLTDEIYGELTYGKKHFSFASIPDMRERTIVVNGFSKAFAMTGWRLGFTAAPAPITNQMLKIHQFAIMSAPTTAQFAAIEALREGDEDIEEMKAEYNRRRTHLVERLRKMGITCFTPEGAFYVFPNVSGFGLTSEEFCEKLLREYGVAIVPGTAFGECGEGFARISYAYSMKHIDQALDRMEKMISDLKK